MPQIRFQRHLNSAYQKRIFSSWQGTGPTECAFARPLTPEHGRWPERRRFAQWQREIEAACGFPFIQPLYSTRKDTTDSVFVACMSEESSNRGPGSLRISVAMATYNGAKHIREQLDSIARQTLLPFELVITDDGSTDATLQIAEEFARNAPFTVRIFRNEKRLKFADNFLKAASLCSGDLIAFCDQDDVWLERKLMTCSESFCDPAVYLVVHSAQTLTSSGDDSRRFPDFPRNRVSRIGESSLFPRWPGFAMIIRNELVRVADSKERPRIFLGHDDWFCFLAAACGKIAMLPDTLMEYRQHETNVFGAPEPVTFVRRLRRTAGILEFDELANSELACSRILYAAAEACPKLAVRLRRSALRLEYRSGLHRLRTQIYGANQNLFRRVISFSRIFFLGGYLPDQTGTRLGMSHAMKDLLWGVAGTHKLMASPAVPRMEKKTE